MAPEIIAEFLKLGVPGAIILVCLLVIRSQYMDNKSLYSRLVEVTTELQNARIADSQQINRDTVVALTSMTATLESHKEAMSETRAAYTAQTAAFNLMAQQIATVTAPRGATR